MFSRFQFSQTPEVKKKKKRIELSVWYQALSLALSLLKMLLYNLEVQFCKW